MTKEYNGLELVHRASVPEWNRASTYPPPYEPCWNGGPCTAYYAGWTDNAPQSQFPRSYEEVVVDEYKTPRPDYSATEPWPSVLRRGGVRMTPYEHKKVTTRLGFVSVPRLGSSIAQLRGQTGMTGASCPYYVCLDKVAISDTSTFLENGDGEYWLGQNFPFHTFSALDSADIFSAIQQVKERATLASYRDFDALTELAQAKQTAREFGSTARAITTRMGKLNQYYTDLTTYRFLSLHPPKDLLKHASRAVRKFGSVWMAYRYFLTPLLYSLRDIEIATRKPLMTTDKATVAIKPKYFNPVVNRSLPHIMRTTEGSVTVRAEVVATYHNSSMPFAYNIGMNPLVTAWELIPLSFVADWIVNIGDAIKLNFAMNYAQEYAACWSIRTKTVVTDTLSYPYDQTSTSPWYVTGNCGVDSACWPTNNRPPTYSKRINGTAAGMLKSVETDSYYREVFHRNGWWGLNLEPSISWKRVLDSIVLTNNLLTGMRNVYR